MGLHFREVNTKGKVRRVVSTLAVSRRGHKVHKLVDAAKVVPQSPVEPSAGPSQPPAEHQMANVGAEFPDLSSFDLGDVEMEDDDPPPVNTRRNVSCAKPSASCVDLGEMIRRRAR